MAMKTTLKFQLGQCPARNSSSILPARKGERERRRWRCSPYIRDVWANLRSVRKENLRRKFKECVRTAKIGPDLRLRLGRLG